jgi:HSP20 family protein
MSKQDREKNEAVEPAAATETTEAVDVRTRDESCCTYEPAADVTEDANEYRVVMDLPGVEPGDVDIKFEKGRLSVHGKVRPRQESGTSYRVREYGVGDYAREFRLTSSIDADGIAAEMQDGRLTLHLPKASTAKPRTIPVNPA